MSTLREKSHLAYSQMADQAKHTEALGWEAKVSVGKFGKRELDAHKEIFRLYGRHQAFAEAADDYAALQASHEELIDALHRAVTEMKFWAKEHADAEIFIAEKALDNAAKLAPTRTGGSGLCQGKKGVL